MRDDECGDTGGDVDDGSSGEVDCADAAGGGPEPAAGRPDPVGEWVVDDEGPEEGEEGVGAEFDAFGEGAGDEGGGDDGEHALEHDEDEFGDAGAVVDEVGGDAGEEEEVRVPADDVSAGLAEGHGVTNDDPFDADDSECGQGVHHRAKDVFTADHAGVEEGESGDHEHDERGADEHPCGIARVRGASEGGGDWGVGGGCAKAIFVERVRKRIAASAAGAVRLQPHGVG